MNNKQDYLKQFKDKIISDFIGGKSVYKLSKEYNTSFYPIKQLLINEGCELRNHKQSQLNKKIYSLDMSCFNIINEESAYWVGMLITDGSVNNEGSLDLSLKESDINHLEKFKLFLKTNSPIKIRNNKRGFNKNGENLCRLNVYSIDLIEKLKHFNIVPNKTFIVKPPEQLKHNKHFWRGVIDGDGYISFSNKLPRVGLLGTKDLCEGFLNFIKESFPNEAINVSIREAGKMFTICFQSKFVYKIIDLLYKNSSIYLDRKYNRYLEYISKRESPTIYKQIYGS